MRCEEQGYKEEELRKEGNVFDEKFSENMEKKKGAREREMMIIPFSFLELSFILLLAPFSKRRRRRLKGSRVDHTLLENDVQNRE